MKYFSSLALLAGLTTSAMAAGSYDGIYVYTSVQSGDLVSVHQSGDTVVLVSLSSKPNTLAATFELPAVYRMTPEASPLWEHSIGTLVGSTATVTTPFAFIGACSVTSTVTFSANGMTIKPTAGTTTEEGKARNVSCGNVLRAVIGTPGSVTYTLAKVF